MLTLFQKRQPRGVAMIVRCLACVVLYASIVCVPAFGQDHLGNWSANRFDPNSTSNRFGAGSRFRSDSVTNPFGPYGNRFSNRSVTNPYATEAPKLFDSKGNYRGRLSTNRYDPDSVSNPFGRYGSRFSPDSVNNRFGAGNRFSPDSPTNRFGRGLSIYGK